MEYTKVTIEPFSCKVTLGLQRGYIGEKIPKEEYITEIQAWQDRLMKEEDLYLSVGVSESLIVMSGQCEPHMVLNFINYPRFPQKPEILSAAIEKLVRHLMDLFDQNRTVIEYPDTTVMLEKSPEIDPRIRYNH